MKQFYLNTWDDENLVHVSTTWQLFSGDQLLDSVNQSITYKNIWLVDYAFVPGIEYNVVAQRHYDNGSVSDPIVYDTFEYEAYENEAPSVDPRIELPIFDNAIVYNDDVEINMLPMRSTGSSHYATTWILRNYQNRIVHKTIADTTHLDNIIISRNVIDADPNEMLYIEVFFHDEFGVISEKATYRLDGQTPQVYPEFRSALLNFPIGVSRTISIIRENDIKYDVLIADVDSDVVVFKLTDIDVDYITIPALTLRYNNTYKFTIIDSETDMLYYETIFNSESHTLDELLNATEYFSIEEFDYGVDAETSLDSIRRLDNVGRNTYIMPDFNNNICYLMLASDNGLYKRELTLVKNEIEPIQDTNNYVIASKSDSELYVVTTNTDGNINILKLTVNIYTESASIETIYKDTDGFYLKTTDILNVFYSHLLEKLIFVRRDNDNVKLVAFDTKENVFTELCDLSTYSDYEHITLVYDNQDYLYIIPANTDSDKDDLSYYKFNLLKPQLGLMPMVDVSNAGGFNNTLIVTHSSLNNTKVILTHNVETDKMLYLNPNGELEVLTLNTNLKVDGLILNDRSGNGPIYYNSTVDKYGRFNISITIND